MAEPRSTSGAQTGEERRKGMARSLTNVHASVNPGGEDARLDLSTMSAGPGGGEDLGRVSKLLDLRRKLQSGVKLRTLS